MAISTIGPDGLEKKAGTGPAFQAASSGSLTVTNNVTTKVQINTKGWDTNNNFDTTLYRFTPTVAGYYQINGYGTGLGSTTTNLFELVIYKNGITSGIGSSLVYYAAGYNSSAANVSGIVYCNGSTDYIELYGRVVGSGACSIGANTILQGCLVRAT